jgi:signal transduction histidine kinase
VVRRYLTNLPIRFKILGLTVMIVLIVILPTLVFVTFQALTFAENDLKRQSQTLLNILESDVDAVLDANDPAKASVMLKTLEKFGEVENAAIYHHSGGNKYETLAQYNKTQTSNLEFSFDLDFIRRQSGNIFNFKNYQYAYKIVERNGVVKGAILIRLNKDTLNKELWRITLNSSALVLALLLLAGFIAQVIERRISRPIAQLAEVTNQITQEGDYSVQVRYDSKDEIGRLYQSFNRLLVRTNNQNQKIQELNQSLDQKIQERVAELTRAKEEADRRTKEAEQARATAEALTLELERKVKYDHTLARLTEVMQSQSTQNIEKWGDHVLFHIIQQINGLQGAIYAADEDREGGEVRVRLLSTYAFEIKQMLKKVMKAGDGLTGEVAKTKKMIYLDNLPEGYLKATSALGEANARYLLIMPLIAEDQIQGILELASFHPFSQDDISMLQNVSENIAYALLIVKNKDNIERLLNETRQKNNMLLLQEEQLKLKINELEATQSEMRRVEQELRHSEESLRSLNENLENLVQARTRELQQTLENLQSTQAQLVQSEKMASLGQLIAGIAHEINTPIGAIKASAGNIDDMLPSVTDELPGYMQEMNQEQKAIFRQLLEIGYRGEKTMTSKEERAKRKELTQILTEAGVQNADSIARNLVELGITEIKPEYQAFLNAPHAEQWVNVMLKICHLKLNLSNIQVASDKTKKIVFALKSYAYKQSDDHATPTDVVASMDVILTLYSSQMKQGIELVRNFEDNLPLVPTFPDELGQVWTNIIHNALQAMHYKGKLQIDIYRKDNFVTVDITDNGPGIPPEIQEKIFQPFFTTKAKGEGTGLGLDICRKIILKHKGDLSVDSEPGRTTFRVQLPIEA